MSDRLISLQLYKLKFELPSAVPPARSRIPAIATAVFLGGLWQLCGEQAGSEALGLVDEFVSSIVSLTRVPFRVLVCAMM